MTSEHIKLSQPTTSETLKLYDLHLSSSKFHTIPDFTGLTEKVPANIQATWYNLTQTIEQKLIPGFMGLNLPADLAAELLERIEIAGGRGLVIPNTYRQPKVTKEMAYPIAEQEIVSKQALLFPNYNFEPTKLFREDIMWWDFRALSPELSEVSHIPGGVIARVDKLDGHIWTAAEQVYLYAEEEYYLESSTTLEPMEALKLAATQFGLEWSTDHKHNNIPCLKAAALVIGATVVKSPSQTFIQKKYGFRPTVRMWFRLNRYKKGYEAAEPLMMQVVALVLQHDPGDAVLLFDEGNLSVLLQRISGQLNIDAKLSSWIGSELS
ncbi:SitI3 family protein [Aliterella atlantica]|uniref:Uncharacterized protein n=1 Tax=Aliterella atlantica CENA595 TaxID=1618023 RepID=A0A0D8ZMV5_9CYAN|nr:SitI3 family protein [Aliterella atlantica]KJH69774.1 hypothetical protein UH38_21915 [Aliterella atlantica CENA595]